VRAFSARLLKLLEHDLVVEEEADLRGRCNARAQKDEVKVDAVKPVPLWPAGDIEVLLVVSGLPA